MRFPAVAVLASRGGRPSLGAGVKNPPILRSCTAPGCPTPVAGGRCPKHAGYARKQRDTWTSLYGPEWPAIRLDYLARHPRCTLCPRQARIPDHYPVPLRRLLERGVGNPHHDRYLRPMCWSCHSKATGKSQPSGFRAQQL